MKLKLPRPLVSRLARIAAGSYEPWPRTQPAWLAPWCVWKVTAKGARPNAPGTIPRWAWCYLAWALWRIAGAAAEKRPACAPLSVPVWSWDALGRIADRLAPPKPAPAPVPPPAPVTPPAPSTTFLPGVWVSDGFQPEVGMTIDALLGFMRAYGCRTALFQANAGGWQGAFLELRQLSYDAQLWASCSQIDPAALRSILSSYRPSRFVAQIETQSELDDFRRFSDAGVFVGVALDIVIISPLALDPSELRARGVQRTWCEAYIQEGREPSDFCDQAGRWWRYPSPLPVIGVYNGTGRSAYNLAPFGGAYTIWRWEQAPPQPS